MALTVKPASGQPPLGLVHVTVAVLSLMETAGTHTIYNKLGNNSLKRKRRVGSVTAPFTCQWQVCNCCCVPEIASVPGRTYTLGLAAWSAGKKLQLLPQLPDTLWPPLTRCAVHVIVTEGCHCSI